jgi:hypothetical protein
MNVFSQFIFFPKEINKITFILNLLQELKKIQQSQEIYVRNLKK